ncbi:MAG: right-handed parallel beta-helix repeat-containing protein [Kiritimatiellae bacterium]|nr:right-handed parallel beta-helix repeat-containing protein [Kiritimatiellia bacterium]
MNRQSPCAVTSKILVAALVVCLAPTAASPAAPPEPLRRLYVAPGGADTNDGLSREAALATLSAAAKRVKPGDLVLVGGGTYRERVKLERPGTAEHPIVFRAMPGETALLTFGEKPAGWRRVNGTRFCYAVAWPRLPNDVWDERDGCRYVGVGDPLTLERMPGSYRYEGDRAGLVVHPLGSRTPEAAGIVVAAHSDYSLGRTTGKIRPGLESWFGRATVLWDKGIEFAAPHNVVEGFVVAYYPIGIHIGADFCVARRNTVYGCREGIYACSGDKGLVEGNRCIRNYSHGIVVQTTNDVVVRGNVCLHNEPTGAAFQGHTTGKTGNPHNLALYGGWLPGDVSFIGNTVIAASGEHVFRIKNTAGRINMTQNVLVGGHAGAHFPSRARGGRGADFSFNTIVGGSLFDRHAHGSAVIGPDHCEGGKSKADAPLYLPASAAPEDAFADPVRHDYRLRADSPHLGKGAHPKPAPLRYVSVKGDDSADGRTPRTAWRTIGKAAGAALPGETVCILPGTYCETVRMPPRAEQTASIAFRSHGRGSVVLDGEGKREYGLVLDSVRGIVVDGLTFRGFTRAAVLIENGTEIELAENVLEGPSVGVAVAGGSGLALLNNTFHRCHSGLDARGTGGGLTLRNNLFVSAGGAPVALDASAKSRLISERNAFAGAGADAWLGPWQAAVRETHPSLAVDVALVPPHFRLPKDSPLAFAGLTGKPFGARGAEPDAGPVRIEDFRVASVSPHQAIVAWRTPFDFPDATLRWNTGDGTAKSQHVPQDRVLKETECAARIEGLAAGTTCNVTLDVRTRDGRKGQAELAVHVPQTARTPAILYVAPTGRDDAAGRSRAQPLRSLSAAALLAVPGDTVLVAPGTYPETLTMWTGGISPAQRVTFRSETPGEAVIDCGLLRSLAIRAQGVKHVTIDGFRIVGDMKEAVRIQNAKDVVFVNNVLPFSDRTHEKLYADNCRGLLISNNVFATGWTSILARNCDDVRIEHNTVSHGGINSVWLDGRPGARYRIANNILYGRMSDAKDNPAFTVKPTDNLLCDYNLYWQNPKPRGGVALFNDAGTRGNLGRKNARTIEEAVERYGVERNGRLADPRFINLRENDFRLKPDSPAVGMGEGGVTVGWRAPNGHASSGCSHE